MIFFSQKTTQELETYLFTLPLSELESLNHQFGDYLESEQSKYDDYERQSSELNRQLVDKYHELLQVKKQKGTYEKDEERRKENLCHLPGNGAERYMLMSHIFMYSPEEEYNKKLQIAENRITELKKQIENTESLMKTNRSDVSISVSQLKILNQIIEEKQEEVALEIESNCNLFS